MDKFDSIYHHGMVRSAVCVPSIRVADPAFNTEETLKLAATASENAAALVLFPELGLSGYSNEDLFHQDALLHEVLHQLHRLKEASRSLKPVIIAGAPLRFTGALFNCAVVVFRGNILGIIPKTYLPNYREFYEKRQFTAGSSVRMDHVHLFEEKIPFGSNLIFQDSVQPDFCFHAEICEDVWAPISPSHWAALAGATILTNLSASNITIGKADFRRQLCAMHSARCLSAYLYSAAGFGESTTDLAWDGYALIYENGDLLQCSKRFQTTSQVIYADLDLQRLAQDRMRSTTFHDSAAIYLDRVSAIRRIPFTFHPPSETIPLIKDFERFPFVPADTALLDERCYEVYNIQIQGLQKRLAATGIKKVIVGVSGGLDSTQALIVAAKTMDNLGYPRTNVLAYTMPGFATSSQTHQNASDLMQALQVSSGEIDIRPSARQMLTDLGHPFSRDEEVYDVTFENVQAGERTSHLFRLANFHDGLVVGTGDLSELALGWTTYGVGDQMAHYNVNASVPKTLIQHLLRWTIVARQFDETTSHILQSILDTEISPELIPEVNGEDALPAQRTEQIIGPYELHDFFLYYITRFGFLPSKVAFLAQAAWSDPEKGLWPPYFPAEKRHAYTLTEIKHWLYVFLYRFFKLSQFKRSAMPNGPKVGSGGSLSPRGDWRAPSDSEAVLWLKELKENVPD
ncbi:MAG: NAD(+) synthase [Anaerolineales bacterium]|nr:NAD(+) synthase [Anaerolineales bacterium]